MEVQAITKYAKMSPIKVRQVAKEIRNLPANYAAEVLGLIPRKSAQLLLKTLKSALANAENNHNLSSDNLIVKEASIDEGPALKRFRPAARGQAHPYKKRTSHLRVVLAEREENNN